MGDQLACTVQYNGKTFSGKALLETSEIIFRGDTRLKIPFSGILETASHDGELRLRTKEGLFSFALGPKAEKWREKIVHPKTLLDKLGLKPGDTVLLRGEFSADFLASLKKHGAVTAEGKTTKAVPWVFLAAESRQDLLHVKPFANSLRGAAALWIVYPKGQKSITEADVRSAGLKAGLTDVKVARFSDTHTTLKFVIPESKR